MNFPKLEYIAWAKAQPRVAINLARSGIDHCPPSLLKVKPADLATTLPVKYGYAPLTQAIARRYGVSRDRVFTVSGGTSFANYVACAAALDGAAANAEVLVEWPTYEPVLKAPLAFGHKVRRFHRLEANAYAVHVDEFESMVTSRTRLAMVTNLHNPSGARIPMATLRRMARALARVSAYLLVDEVYLECVFRRRPESCVHAGPNVITTNSLTKAYGLDGLRAGWILGPRDAIARAGRINDLMTNNGVAPGETMALAAFRRLREIDARAHRILDPNLAAMRAYFEGENRLTAFLPDGGNVVFARLPNGVSADRFVAHLVRRYSTLVVPGRFFDSNRHIRISFGCDRHKLERGLRNISRALDEIL
jgi:aspartate/methionine/tyrosine aminotransferase